MNLNNYQEAAEHVLRALAMQQQNSDEDVGEPSLRHLTEDNAGASSTQLWDTLATCCNSMGRSDLAEACQTRNLAPFRADFYF
jgi:peroxin-5